MNLKDIFSKLKIGDQEPNLKVNTLNNDNIFNISDNEYNKYCEHILDNFNKYVKDTDLLNYDVEIVSPSGKYLLHISNIITRVGCWMYTLGVVRKMSNKIVIAIIKRNYSVFKHSWIIKNNEEYLITAEHYQGLTVVNCDAGWHQSYIPKDAVKDCGFCFDNAQISPNEKYLMISGSYLQAPSATIIYDFSSPQSLPYKRLQYIEFDSDDTPFNYTKKWSNDTIEYTLDIGKLKNPTNAYDIYRSEFIKFGGKHKDIISQYKWFQCNDKIDLYNIKAQQTNMIIYKRHIESYIDLIKTGIDWYYDNETKSLLLKFILV